MFVKLFFANLKIIFEKRPEKNNKRKKIISKTVIITNSIHKEPRRKDNAKR